MLRSPRLMMPSDVDADLVSNGRFCGGAAAAWHRVVVLVAGICLLAGCGTVELSGPALTRIDKALEVRKGPSVAAWERGGPERRDRLKLAELQTGLLLRWDDISISSRQTERDSVHWTVSMKGKQGSISSAVPLTRDGYFLTASHCVEQSRMTLVLATQDRKMTKRPVRVVWRGNPDERGPDLALIHADLKPLLPFFPVDIIDPNIIKYNYHLKTAYYITELFHGASFQ